MYTRGFGILRTQVLTVAWQALFLPNYLFSPLTDWNLRKIMANIWNGDYGVYLFHVFRNSRQLNANDFLCLPDGNLSKYSQGQKRLCCTEGLSVLPLRLQQHSCLVLMEGLWWGLSNGTRGWGCSCNTRIDRRSKCSVTAPLENWTWFTLVR